MAWACRVGWLGSYFLFLGLGAVSWCSLITFRSNWAVTSENWWILLTNASKHWRVWPKDIIPALPAGPWLWQKRGVCLRTRNCLKVLSNFYGGRWVTEASSWVRRLTSDRWSNNLIHSPVYTVPDAEIFPDTDILRTGSRKDGEWSVGASETVWQRGRKGAGESSTSFDRSPGPVSSSSWSASGCPAWLRSTTIRGMHISESPRRTWSGGRRTLSCRCRSRGRRQGTLPERRRCPDSGWRRDSAACRSRSGGDGGSASRCADVDVDGDCCPSSVMDEPISRSGSSSSIVYACTYRR